MLTPLTRTSARLATRQLSTTAHLGSIPSIPTTFTPADPPPPPTFTPNVTSSSSTPETTTWASPLTLPPAPPPLDEPLTPVSPPIRRPIGAFRGWLFGLLTGATLVGGWGYFSLLESYRDASERMLVSVEELKTSTQAMTGHLARIEKVEQTVAQLKASAAKAKDLDAARAEYRKLAEAQHLDTLDVKAHIWGLEQDLDQISKRAQTVNVRI